MSTATLAKDAVLQKTGSHYVDTGSSRDAADGIAKEQVFLYFSAVWRGRPVIVDMQADRYAASVWDGDDRRENKLTTWRIYAVAAKSHDPARNGGRGEDVSGTARSALSELCEPIVRGWLGSDTYFASFQNAVAHMIMRMFRDEYSAQRNVSEALATFKKRLWPETFQAISDVLDARNAYDAAKERAFEAINEEG